jgi:16S rRNA (guanine527-N7)-methyltransferase
VPEPHLALIDRLAAAFAHQLTEAPRGALCSYLELVETWNRKLDLTAARGAEALCEVMLADAFSLSDHALVPERASVLDVGSGAGAPIVPLLLLRSDLSALCVEPQQKRATFLRMLSARLSLLGRMRVVERRLDPDRPEGIGETFDVACSRATFAKEQWLPLGLQLAPRVLLLLARDEPPDAPAGARLLCDRAYALPFSGTPRRIAVYLRG